MVCGLFRNLPMIGFMQAPRNPPCVTRLNCSRCYIVLFVDQWLQVRDSEKCPCTNKCPKLRRTISARLALPSWSCRAFFVLIKQTEIWCIFADKLSVLVGLGSNGQAKTFEQLSSNFAHDFLKMLTKEGFRARSLPKLEPNLSNLFQARLNLKQW